MQTFSTPTGAGELAPAVVFLGLFGLFQIQDIQFSVYRSFILFFVFGKMYNVVQI
jgi:hypothetical protein